ncbi:Deleted in malignant brain tumors 1 protein [Trichuris trichiura]|uniref:Deleted in malignant brain tumors 1 protein n=1 Tax=Trichuris trichiura TaxID=36087 RepID=A0A077YYE6_TRITR|nr:Deleted in malignant brain tumors 1 protein [Trichuris trichiura]
MALRRVPDQSFRFIRTLQQLRIRSIVLLLVLSYFHCSLLTNGAAFIDTLQEAGGTYTLNHTLYQQDGPYKVTRPIFVQAGANLTIEQGVKLYFASGVGITVQGVLNAIGNKYVQIEMLPWLTPPDNLHAQNYSSIRLVDGPSTRQGRLQVLFKGKWRAVCTMMTNWTSVDYRVACRTMGFDDGGFWKWFRRNNDTMPFVMPKPGCNYTHGDLHQCTNWTTEKIMLAENLCQGEDDLGLVCWGPPTFPGWEFHWKGLEFQDAPWHYVPLSGVSIKKESKSRLEHVNIWYAGYDRERANATAALLIHGVAPFMNYIDVKYSAQDGVRITSADGPVEITNSTISYNRGHGVVVENTTDGRLFINETRIEFNFGDGIQFRPLLGLSYRPVVDEAFGRDSIIYYEPEIPEIDICTAHVLNPARKSFPRIVSAQLTNTSGLTTAGDQWPCYLVTIDDSLYLYVCEYKRLNDLCKFPRYKIPVRNGLLLPSINARNLGGNLWIGLKYEDLNTTVRRESRVVMKIHSSIDNFVFYGLNVSNSRVCNNGGSGIYLQDVRDRTALNNVTISGNQHTAGVHIFGGVGDLWINNSFIMDNWGDGVNVSHCGGSLVVNGTQISRNRMRGFAFHHREMKQFLPLKFEVVFKGRPALNNDYTATYVNENSWGGILIGNFCTTADKRYVVRDPRVVVAYVEFVGNRYHPAFEYHSCQSDRQPITRVEVSGSVFRLSTGICFRIQPAVNIKLDINDCRFVENHRPVLLIRNRDHPQLANLPATVSITRNHMKYNVGPFIVSIGLNEPSFVQNMHFHVQNEVKENRVVNPYPLLNGRTLPHAAVIITSSNVIIRRNCFYNIHAEFEIATDLNEHALVIDARENNYGSSVPSTFMYKIFDQFKRYSLAKINVDPYAAVCNSQNPKITDLRNFYRRFRQAERPNIIGGTVYENTDLPRGDYLVVDDLHVSPGSILTLQPGTVLRFQNSIGMLVQGELVRTDYSRSPEPILFTLAQREKQQPHNIRIISDDDNKNSSDALSGRLEVLVNGQWGTICNRSWTVNLAAASCHQLGMILDPEFLENWRVYPSPGSLPVVMDNIRCEELEYDITQCRHDGVDQAIHLSCKPAEVVGVRCVQPMWAGVRYSLLASPASVTGQTTIKHLIIEKAGLLDFRLPEFAAAFTVDWNYHLFEHLTVQDNFWTGVDIIYTDPIKKPKLLHCQLVRNRRHGLRLRSVGLTLENVTLAGNENAGIRYNPQITQKMQRDVSSWLRRDDAVFHDGSLLIMPHGTEIVLTTSLYESRKYLIASSSSCGLNSVDDCIYTLTVRSTAISPGVEGRVGVQIINRPSQEGDENLYIFDEAAGGMEVNMRGNLIEFPWVSSGDTIRVRYKRTYGLAEVAVLLFHISDFEYLDDFVHVRSSAIRQNQYGLSGVHYSSFFRNDGSVLLRRRRSKLWFQKTYFTGNRQAVIWVNGPLMEVEMDSPLAEVAYLIDNCSVSFNNGSVIETHRDLQSSANSFWWKIWQSNFFSNYESGLSISLPDPQNVLLNLSHRFELRESNFQDNVDFQFLLSGYYAWLNISSNNFTMNRARHDIGLMKLAGMEKELVMERNRWRYNQGKWVLSFDIKSNALVNYPVPCRVHRNYFFDNYFLTPEDNYVDNWPRSFALGLFGVQNVEVHFNNFRNTLLDFEVVAGLRTTMFLSKANISHNYFGQDTEVGVLQRIFDFDDWNIFCLANVNPYFVTEERSINWEWRPEDAQLGMVAYEEPSVYDLHGRLYKSLTLKRQREKWTVFPYYFKPDKPYYIRKDLTIMPGAKLTIEKGVEIHIYPNVRILVLGSLEAQGTFWEPIRLKPVNLTDIAHFDVGKKIFASHGGDSSFRRKEKRDAVYEMFPLLHRQYSFYQKFETFLVDGPDARTGFLEIYNATTGERVPICDRQFTKRNAEVVCREHGFQSKNVYVRIGPRWNNDPKLHLVKSYSEPRQCFGNEKRLADCDLRLSNDANLWKCVDAEHFVFLHCGRAEAVNPEYVGHWGGLFFAADSVETARNMQSSLRHVEIVGAGLSHNDSSAAITVVYRSVIFDHVNVTNSSMHAIEIVAPHAEIVLNKMNITDNLGVGLRLLGLNMHSSTTVEDEPLLHATFPYYLYGLIEMCSVDKVIEVEKRVLVYYKYDSYPVDCYKTFLSLNSAKKLEFKLLLANIYNSSDQAIRKDRIAFFNGRQMSSAAFIDSFGHETSRHGLSQPVRSSGNALTVHLRANAADGAYGLIAEIVTVPAPPDPAPLKNIFIHEGRFERNDRGAVRYDCTGDVNAVVDIDLCSFNYNGYQLWENFTTSSGAVRLSMYNTQSFKLQNSMFFRNAGGLSIFAASTTPSARMVGLIRNCAFGNNVIWETLKLVGRNYQKVYAVNNYFGRNWSPYKDVVFVDHMLVNFTRNTFYNNTGTHIVHLGGYRDVSTEFQLFRSNVLYDNIATGHGYHFIPQYGYFGKQEGLPIVPSLHSRKRRRLAVQTSEKVAKVQPPEATGTSFEWWANVGFEAERYHSTVFAASGQVKIENNFFSNPDNNFELTTAVVNLSDAYSGPVDARQNYWGQISTPAVASGKIRDGNDHDYLLKVNFLPVLESNTSLLDGSCPPGWFEAGYEEWKSYRSCFLFVPGAVAYRVAEEFCKEQGGYLPFFRDQDKRLAPLAKKVDMLNRQFSIASELVPTYMKTYETRFWISSVTVPPEKCGYLSSKTASIGVYNCDDVLPFVCEKGPKPYEEPIYLQPAVIATIVVSTLLIFIIGLLTFMWWLKSKQRAKQFFERKSSLRASIRSLKNGSAAVDSEETSEAKQWKYRPSSPDLIEAAHRNLVFGSKSIESLTRTARSSSAGKIPSPSLAKFPTEPGYDSLDSSTVYQNESLRSGRKVKCDVSPSSSYCESAYRSDFSPSSERSSLAGTPSLPSFQAVSRRWSPWSINTKLTGQTAAMSGVTYAGKNKVTEHKVQAVRAVQLRELNKATISRRRVIQRH